MEVGVGLCLAFALLDHLRVAIKEKRLKVIETKLDALEASDGRKRAITEEIIAKDIEVRKGATSIVSRGIWLSLFGASLLCMQLICLGLFPSLNYNIWEVAVFIILPVFIMPLTLFWLYSFIGIKSREIDKEIAKNKDALERINRFDKSVSEIEATSNPEENGEQRAKVIAEHIKNMPRSLPPAA